MTEKTFLFELREAARLCSKAEYKVMLANVASEVELGIERLEYEPTRANMQDLVGAWTRADKLLAAAPPEGSPDPLGGDTEATELERIAA